VLLVELKSLVTGGRFDKVARRQRIRTGGLDRKKVALVHLRKHRLPQGKKREDRIRRRAVAKELENM